MCQFSIIRESCKIGAADQGLSATAAGAFRSRMRVRTLDNEKPFESLTKVPRGTFYRQHSASLRAADQGLEPQLTAPEAVVLPLDESAINLTIL